MGYTVAMMNYDTYPAITSLAPREETPKMDFTEALTWAESRNAVLRFNGNEEHEGKSFRVTIVGHKPEDRIIAIHKVPQGADLMTVMAEAIAEVKTEFENTLPTERPTLRVV